ncbi:unnamed protein product, partial [Symbiodinium pilosum]
MSGLQRSRSETPSIMQSSSRRLSTAKEPKDGHPAPPVPDPRLWAKVRDCLARPENYDQVFHAVCVLLCESRAERDVLKQRLDEVERANTLSAAEAKRRDAELRKMREELKLQAAVLEESNTACQALAKELTAAKDAKNRAQMRVRQLQSKSVDADWAAGAV